jgi:ADP-heptose:LPS heptosyltransferase
VVSLRMVWFCAGYFRDKTLKLIDFYIGGFFVRFFRTRKTCADRLDLPGVRRVLVIRPGGMGDALLLLPVLKALHDALPGREIDVFADRRNSAVFVFAKGYVRRVYKAFGWRFFANLFLLRARAYDVVIDSEQWHNVSAVVVRFLKPGYSAGFDTRALRSAWYSKTVGYDPDGYEMDNFFRLIREGLGCRVERADFPAEGLLGGLNCSPVSIGDIPSGYVCICVSASIGQRRVPVFVLRDTVVGLLMKRLPVVLIGGAFERGYVRAVEREFAGREDFRSFVGRIGLRRTAQIISRSRCCAGFDSGVMHLAFLLGVPSVWLFGPGIVKKWAPPVSTARVLSSGLACSPCTVFGYTPACPDNRCMRLLRAEDIVAAVEDAVSNKGGV